MEGLFKSLQNQERWIWWPRREWSRLIPFAPAISETRRAACAWLDGDLLGVVGVLASTSPDDSATRLARDLLSLGTYAKAATELDACKYMLVRSDRPLLLLTPSGRIVAYTLPAQALLRLLPRPVSEIPEVAAMKVQPFPRAIRLNSQLWVAVSPLPVVHVLAPMLLLGELNTNLNDRKVSQLNRKPLTKSEQIVAILLRERLSNKELASRLGISFHTVRKHVSAVLTKLGYQDRVEFLLASRPVQVPGLSETPPISTDALSNVWRDFDPSAKPLPKPPTDT